MGLVDIWELIGSSARGFESESFDDDVHYSEVEFTVYLDRKPRYYIVNIIIPVVFLVIVVLMVSLLVSWSSASTYSIFKPNPNNCISTNKTKIECNTVSSSVQLSYNRRCIVYMCSIAILPYKVQSWTSAYEPITRFWGRNQVPIVLGRLLSKVSNLNVRLCA